MGRGMEQAHHRGCLLVFHSDITIISGMVVVALASAFLSQEEVTLLKSHFRFSPGGSLELGWRWEQAQLTPGASQLRLRPLHFWLSNLA